LIARSGRKTRSTRRIFTTLIASLLRHNSDKQAATVPAARGRIATAIYRTNSVEFNGRVRTGAAAMCTIVTIVDCLLPPSE